MHVGVFLDDKEPTDGGGYTFVQDIVASVIELAGTSKNRFTLFCPPNFAKSVAASLPSNMMACEIGARGRVASIIRELRHTSSAFAVFWTRPCKLEQLAVARGVEVMWFVGGAYDTLDIPYFTTVWDLQHRTHPWFPEVSSNGLWDHREAFFARHLGRAARIITGTKIGQQEIAKFYGIDEEKIELLPHPTPRFALAAQSDSRPPSKLTPGYFYYPAQFWPHKNHANLLFGYRLFCDSVQAPPKLLLTGAPKNNYTYIKALVSELNLDTQVEFLGFVPSAEVAALYEGALALVYASFSGPENLPPLEAFALGCPVLNSDFPGAREQLGDAALYFDPHDPAAIAEAMTQVVASAELRESLASKGRVRAKEWTSADFVRGALNALDAFESERRAWGPG